MELKYWLLLWFSFSIAAVIALTVYYLCFYQTFKLQFEKKFYKIGDHIKIGDPKNPTVMVVTWWPKKKHGYYEYRTRTLFH